MLFPSVCFCHGPSHVPKFTCRSLTPRTSEWAVFGAGSSLRWLSSHEGGRVAPAGVTGVLLRGGEDTDTQGGMALRTQGGDTGTGPGGASGASPADAWPGPRPRETPSLLPKLPGLWGLRPSDQLRRF